MPPRVILDGERTDEISMAEVIQRVKLKMEINVVKIVHQIPIIQI